MQRATAAVQGAGGEGALEELLEGQAACSCLRLLEPAAHAGGGEGKRGEMVKFWEGEGVVARLPGGGIG